jgi:hypothetical protein
MVCIVGLLPGLRSAFDDAARKGVATPGWTAVPRRGLELVGVGGCTRVWRGSGGRV